MSACALFFSVSQTSDPPHFLVDLIVYLRIVGPRPQRRRGDRNRMVQDFCDGIRPGAHVGSLNQSAGWGRWRDLG